MNTEKNTSNFYKTLFIMPLLLILLISFSGSTGCGEKKKKKKLSFTPTITNTPTPPIVGFNLNSFEDKEKDFLLFKPFKKKISQFNWRTQGLAEVKVSNEHATNGKTCAKVIFSCPPDFLAPSRKNYTPLPKEHLGFPLPTPRPTAPWIVAVTYPDPEFPSQLKITDWTKYNAFAVDVYYQESEHLPVNIRLWDNKNFSADFPFNVSGTTVNTLKITKEEMEKTRLRTDNVKYITFWLDTSSASSDRVLYIDNLRLEQSAPTVTPTPSASPWWKRIFAKKPTKTPTPKEAEEGEEESDSDESIQGEETPSEEETSEESSAEEENEELTPTVVP